MSKFIFVVGGVMSGVGKGTATASIGKILQSKGFRVTAVKIDPYINIDAGTMNPVEHGEVFVTEDGDETDQDIGNYERFLDTDITSVNYMTTGRVYRTVIEKERNLEYGGKTVEVVPHVPEEVIRRIRRATKDAQADFCIIEVGGTVGEYQNVLFLEAARMMRLKKPKDVLFVLVSYLPIPTTVGEMKTKPTQHAVRTLNSTGIQPDFIIARAGKPLDEPRKRKIATFCNIDERDVISAPDCASIYEVPGNFERDRVGARILSKFGMRARSRHDMKEWTAFVRKIRKKRKKTVKIGVVGKYFSSGNFSLSDAYISVLEAIKAAAWHQDAHPDIAFLDSVDYEDDSSRLRELSKYDGILIPGGFGTRGVDGKINVIKYVREKKIPYLGICYGMQLASIEFARNVGKLKGAHTAEVDPAARHQIIHVMPGQDEIIKSKRYGGSMRLGAWPCVLTSGTRARRAYGNEEISERHRHRYEFNNAYRDELEARGLVFSGSSPDGRLVEIIELKEHPFFVGVQFHPEFKSRPLRPHPLFRDFVKAALK